MTFPGLAEPLQSTDGFLKNLFGVTDFDATVAAGELTLSADQIRLLDAVRSGHRQLAEICLESGLDTLTARLALSRLEAAGAITQSTRGWRLVG